MARDAAIAGGGLVWKLHEAWTTRANAGNIAARSWAYSTWNVNGYAGVAAAWTYSQHADINKSVKAVTSNLARHHIAGCCHAANLMA